MFRIVKYGASWCGMCKTMDKKLESFKSIADNTEPIEYKSCDEDDIATEAATLGIKSLPTVILYSDDKEIKRWHGIFNVKEINNEIDKWLNSPKTC